MLIKWYWLPKPFSNQKRLQMKVKIELWMSFALADLQVTSHFFGNNITYSPLSKFPPILQDWIHGNSICVDKNNWKSKTIKLN